MFTIGGGGVTKGKERRERERERCCRWGLPPTASNDD